MVAALRCLDEIIAAYADAWSLLACCGDAQLGQHHLSVALGWEMELRLILVLLVLF